MSPNANLDTLSLQARAQRAIGRHQRRIESFTSQLGRPASIYAIILLVTLWVGFNLLAPELGARAFDPAPFSWLQGLVGLSALLMTAIILTTQNRQTQQAEQRSQLDLQVNLLAEQKIAKLIALLEELRKDLPSVKDRVDDVAERMKEPVDPHAVLTALEVAMPQAEVASKQGVTEESVGKANKP